MSETVQKGVEVPKLDRVESVLLADGQWYPVSGPLVRGPIRIAARDVVTEAIRFQSRDDVMVVPIGGILALSGPLPDEGAPAEE